MGRDDIHRAAANRLPPDLCRAASQSPTFFYIVSKFDYAILFSIMHEDKRVCPRFLFSEPVSYVFPDVIVNGSVAGNISLSGISLKVQGFVPMGTVLELQIRFGQSPKVIWAKAEVVRMREVLSEECFEIGLRFIKDEECTRAIGQYINACRTETTNQSRS